MTWRDDLPIHEACDLFPQMSAAELLALGEDIKRNGLKTPIACCDRALADGRNRLDAMQRVDLEPRLRLVRGTYVLTTRTDWKFAAEIPAPQRIADPWAFVVSVNVHRRHLSADQKRDLITKLLKADPTKSNRRVAKLVGVSHPHLAKVREQLEQAGDVETVTTSIDTKGRAQPAQKQRRTADDFAAEMQTRAAPKPVPGIVAHLHADRADDHYQTPEVAVRALLAAERITGRVWEPAAGRGAIVRVLRAAGHDVVATTLGGCDSCGGKGGIDFLQQQRAPDLVELILTNPPYRYANKFVRHALRLVPNVVMLLPLRYLEGQRRSDILDGGQLARVHVFRERLPMMHRDGWQGRKSTSQMAFAWFVWNRNHRGRTELHRISWRTAEGDQKRGQKNEFRALLAATANRPPVDAGAEPANLARRRRKLIKLITDRSQARATEPEAPRTPAGDGDPGDIPAFLRRPAP